MAEQDEAIKGAQEMIDRIIGDGLAVAGLMSVINTASFVEGLCFGAAMIKTDETGAQAFIPLEEWLATDTDPDPKPATPPALPL